MACFHSIPVAAPADRVWKVLRNFYEMSWASSVVETCDPVGQAGPSEPGAQRVLNHSITETLVAVDDLERTIAYRIEDDSALPSPMRLRGCISEARVIPVTADDSSLLVWQSRWDSAEGDVQGFLDGVYKALVTDMRSFF